MNVNRDASVAAIFAVTLFSPAGVTAQDVCPEIARVRGARQIFEILKMSWDMAGFLSAYNTGRQERASCPPRMSTKR